MSDFKQVPQEKDVINHRAILVVSAISLAVFVVGGLWSYRIQRSAEQEFQPEGPAAPPPGVSQIEVGLVNTALFSQDRRADERVAQQTQRLNSYGRVDKDTIHVPIEEAIREALKEQKR